MRRHEVKVPKHVMKQIQDISLPWRDRITRTINLLESDPFIGKKMRGKYEGRWKLRVWPYRIYYSVIKQEKRVIILNVRHRGSAGYK